jgi:hypothetical protein
MPDGNAIAAIAEDARLESDSRVGMLGAFRLDRPPTDIEQEER